MQARTWNQYHIQQCRDRLPQSFSIDSLLLNSSSQDFGGLITSMPTAVFIPQNLDSIQELASFANINGLSVTIRGNGMSQSGQSLATPGGIILNMAELTSVHPPEGNLIWVDANASWAALVKTALRENKIPYVTPYNCHLSVAGVVSAGGIGATSFRYGSATHHVAALEVITADGNLYHVNEDSPLFHACLGGQGQFGIITKACIKLRPCAQQVRTFLLTYTDAEQWIHDLTVLKESVDYLESFCSPSVQGAKLTQHGRKPFAQWLFALHVSVEYNERAPELSALGKNIKPWKILHTQDESIESYIFRHEGRFQMMKITGQWELPHPWYECFVEKQILFYQFQALLDSLPLYYVPVLQVTPIASTYPRGFLMLPDCQDIFGVMILNPGLPEALIPGCLETIKTLDQQFLPAGSKRYLSGYLGAHLTNEYWKQHFAKRYQDWVTLKKQYDPKYLFRSMLHTWDKAN